MTNIKEGKHPWHFPRVAQRDDTKQANTMRNAGISLKRQSETGGRQKRAWGEKEEQAERRVERERKVPDKSIERERWYLQSLAELSETSLPQRFRDAYGMPHRVLVNHVRAADDPLPLRVR